jgi:hypothetical protein
VVWEGAVIQMGGRRLAARSVYKQMDAWAGAVGNPHLVVAGFVATAAYRQVTTQL